MLEYRSALRTELSNLDASKGRVLVARFASAETRPCDVENLLLYNLGISTFAHLRADEVLLSRAFTPAVPPEGVAGLLIHQHHYEVSGKSGLRPDGSVVARLPEIALRIPITVGQVWHDVRTAGVEVNALGADDPLALRLTVHRVGDRPSMLGMVKVLVDGVISALHSHDGTEVDAVAARLGLRLGVAPDHVASLLMARPTAVLGTRRLLWPFRDFVQWNPADDRVVELHVRERALAIVATERDDGEPGPGAVIAGRRECRNV